MFTVKFNKENKYLSPTANNSRSPNIYISPNTVQNRLTSDVVSFSAKTIEYKNKFNTQLKATPNPNLRKELEADKSIYDVDKAFQRLTSLSRYLKEEMVGFITPSGEEWFPKALINFIYGAKDCKVPEEDFKKTAKELWSLIAKADKYWYSQEFINYLSSFKPSPARDATIQAIEEIAREKTPMMSKIAFGYKSDMKKIQKILDHGCAYSGKPMNRTGGWPDQVTLEHIFSSNNGGSDSDFNYILTTSKANDDRGNLPLIDYLKGKDRKRA